MICGGSGYIGMNLIKHLPRTDGSSWKVLYQEALNVGASSSLRPLMIKVAETSEPQTAEQRKDHNYNYYSGKSVIPHDDIFDIPEYYGEQKDKIPHDDDVRDNKYVEIVNDSLKRNRFVSVIVNKKDDKYITTVLGPSNPYVNDVSDPQFDIDARYGGTRMLFTIRNEFLIEADNDDVWIGVCDQCLRKIENVWRAVRMPVPLGGWRYWFCSWKCVVNYAIDNEVEVDGIVSLVKSFRGAGVKIQIR